MWAQQLPAGGRQVLAGPASRSQLCPCQAKRYIPKPKQRKKVPGRQGDLRTRPSTAELSIEVADADELLRELNSGGGGILHDEEEVDWGLDDVAEHARARAQHEQQRWGAVNAPAGPKTGTAGAQSRRRRGKAGIETHGSPLEAGLASVLEQAGEAHASTILPATAVPSGGGADSASGQAGVPSLGQRARAIELEASYARQNPEVVEALRLHGVAVRVRQTDAQDDGDDKGGDAAREAEGKRRGRGRRQGSDERDFEDEEDDLNLSLTYDPSLEEVLPAGSRGGTGSGGGGRKTHGTPTAAGPTAGNDWYGSLAASGFSVRTNEVGEVFLERSVRRKAASAATAGAVSSPRYAMGTPLGAALVSPAGAAAAGTNVASSASSVRAPGGGISKESNSGAGAGSALALESFAGVPAMAAALERLTTPQQALDFLELSFPQWAANGYRLVDARSGLPVPAPCPAEAAYCLRALALTARRQEIGGWRCLDLAAGRQAQGLAECLRVTPPRLLPEVATPQLSAAYFEAARQHWLDPAVQPVIEDPRAASNKQAKPAAAGATAAAPPDRTAAGQAPLYRSPGGAAAALQTSADADGDDVTLEVRSGTLNDPLYDTLLSKYDTLSRHYQLLNEARGAQRQQPALNGRTNGGMATAAGASAGDAASTAGSLQLQPDHPGPDSSSVRPTVAAAAAMATKARGSGAAEKAHATLTAAAAVPPAMADAVQLRAARVDCLVAAIWGMSSLGSTPYFMAETEAALSILVRRLATSPGPDTTWASSPGRAPASGIREASGVPVGLSSWQAGQLLWALGNSRHVTPRLRDLEAIMLRSGGLAAMQPRDVSRVLWGFASLGHRPDRLLLTIRPDWEWQAPGAAPRRGGGSRGGGFQAAGGRPNNVRGFSAQQLAAVVWALAVMQQVDTLPFRSAWGELLRRAKEVPPGEPILTQIWQANLALHLESSTSSSAAISSAISTGGTSVSAVASGTAASSNTMLHSRSGGYTAAKVDLTATGLAAAAVAVGTVGFDAEAAQGLLLRARDVFLAATSGLRRRVQSGYQRQMANTLTALRVMHLLEDNSAGYSIDITLPQLRIAIEADGPTHTSRTPGGAVLGATLMKRRHLQLLGWHVVNVPYKEWDKLSSETARRAFLQERINVALLDRFNFEEEATS